MAGEAASEGAGAAGACLEAVALEEIGVGALAPVWAEREVGADVEGADADERAEAEI